MLPCGKDNKTEGAIGFIICHLDAFTGEEPGFDKNYTSWYNGPEYAMRDLGSEQTEIEKSGGLHPGEYVLGYVKEQLFCA